MRWLSAMRKRVRKDLKTKGIARNHVQNVRRSELPNVEDRREGHTPRHDEKSAEVIDKQRVEEGPLRERVCNIMKIKRMIAGGRRSKVQGGKLEERGRPHPVCFCNDMIRQWLRGGGR